MSQKKRTVLVASPASNQAKKFETTATTWGELKTVLGTLVSGNVEAIVPPANTALTRDDAALPEGDFRVFLVPTKNKAGMTPTQAQGLAREIGNAIVRAAAKVTDNEVDDLKKELVETIENFFGVDLDDCPECEAALAEAKKMMN